MKHQLTFFGSFPLTYLQTKFASNPIRAYCDHTFDHRDTVNKLVEQHIPRLEKFESRQHMIETVHEWQPSDVLLVAGFKYRLPMEIINKFKWVINMHPGDLSNNRGAYPLYHSVTRREPMATVTYHLITDEKLDCGPQLQTIKFPINYGSNYKALEINTDRLAGQMIMGLLNELNTTGTLNSVPTLECENSYQTAPTSEALKHVMNAATLSQIHIPV